MNILYIVQHFAGPNGHSGVRPYEASIRLVRAGHSVTVLCGAFEKASEMDYEAASLEGVRILRAPIPYQQRMTTFDRLRAFAAFMRWAILQGKAQPRPDVVFATSTPLTTGEVGRRVAKFHGVPFVFEVRDLWPEVPIGLGALRNPVLRLLATSMARRTYAAATRVIALSPGMRDGILAWGVPRENVSVIPNCATNELFGHRTDRDAIRHRLGWTSKFVAIHAGSIGRVNNIDYLLDAAAAIERAGVRDVVIAIVGSGTMRAHVEARVVSERLSQVELHPAVPSRELPAILTAADAGLVSFLATPAMHTNSANKFFDYLASGLPVLLNYEGWQAELVRRRGAGDAASADDPVTLANVLCSWKTQQQLVARMGTAARQLAEDEFDRAALVRRLEGVLCSAVEQAGSTGVKLSESTVVARLTRM